MAADRHRLVKILGGTGWVNFTGRRRVFSGGIRPRRGTNYTDQAPRFPRHTQDNVQSAADRGSGDSYDSAYERMHKRSSL